MLKSEKRLYSFKLKFFPFHFLLETENLSGFNLKFIIDIFTILSLY